MTSTVESFFAGSSHLNPRRRRSSSASSSGSRENSTAEDVDDEALLESLDDDFELCGIREKRLEELKKEMKVAQALVQSGHGRLTEIKQEKDVVAILAKEKYSVTHFFHVDFRRCKIMDRHLEAIAPKYSNTRFIKVDVANVPFLVTKLDLKVLPCVVTCVDGITRDKIVGFEGLSDEEGDKFETSGLELRLKQSGVVGQTSKPNVWKSRVRGADDDPEED